MLKAMERYEKRKIVANYARYYLTRMLTSKITKKNIENALQFNRDKP